ncbi:MAG TPA: ABC transporter ATP-binding protein [Jiangellaceae bacterium]
MAQRPADLAARIAVAAHHLSKRYGSLVAVDDVSFEVEVGEIFGIVGPNGAGKTTIVECLQGLRRPDGGDLSVLGRDPHTEPRALRRRIGSQLQESALPDRIKVWEALDLFGATVADAIARDVLLRDWGLDAKRNARFADLSGGQQQRLFVALALVNQPELVFLDEMTTGLDPTARREAWQLIEKIRDRGTTIVLVTHFMDEAEKLCDRVAIVRSGRIVALDTPERLIATHPSNTVIRFGGSAEQVRWFDRLPNVHQARWHAGRLEVVGDAAAIAHVGRVLAERDAIPGDLRVTQAGLEDVYLRLTGPEP